MFLVWSVVLVDVLPALMATTLVIVAHRWSRTPRAFRAWSRTLRILSTQLILISILLALVLIAVFSYPDQPETRPIPLTAYLAALLWCAGPAASGIALRLASRRLDHKSERAVIPAEIEAFS